MVVHDGGNVKGEYCCILSATNVVLGWTELRALRNHAHSKILDEIRQAVNPDSLSIEHDLALIAVVGHGMVRRKGVAARIISAIARADVNIRMLDQGASEFNIILGVEDADFVATLNAIYDEFA